MVKLEPGKAMTRELPPAWLMRCSPPKYLLASVFSATGALEEAGTFLKNCSDHFERAFVEAPSPIRAMLGLV